MRNASFVSVESVLLSVITWMLIGCTRTPVALFEEVPPGKSGVEFENIPATGDSLNFLDYLYYYNGGGVAAGDLNNDGLPDLFFTANRKGGNRLYLNRGEFTFEDITTGAGAGGTADWPTGVTMADVNNDGWLDIYICVVSGKLGLNGANQLLINNRDGTFSDRAAEYGLSFQGFATQSAFFDYDHDGDLDCYLLTQSAHSTDMYRDTSLRRVPGGQAGDRFYRNDSGRFIDVTQASGIYSSVLGYGLGIAVADLDADGWDDIYIGNDFHENDYCYMNQGDGTFREQGAQRFDHYSRFSMGNDIGDYDNDGQPDIVTADMLPAEERYLKTYSGGDALDIYRYNVSRNGYQHQFSRNALQHNLGRGTAFAEVGLQLGIAASDWSWSPLMADFDNDGRKDLFMSNGIRHRPVDLDYIRYLSNVMVRKTAAGNGSDTQALSQMPDGAMHDYIWQGSAESFIDRSADWGMTAIGYSNGAAYADLDLDGNMDLVINRMYAPAGILRNTGNTREVHHWLSVHCKSDSTQANSFGLGCRVWLFHGDSLQYQQLSATRGFQSSSEPIIHFGLGANARVDSMLVVWPGNRMQMIREPLIDHSMQGTFEAAAGAFSYDQYFPSPVPALRDVTDSVQVNWRHVENPFTDQNSQRLIPHQLSDRGPGLAAGDVNGDGFGDLYVCGAAGQRGRLLRSLPDGRFQTDSLETGLLQADEVSALFEDLNGDGYADLYIAMGGNQRWSDDPELHDKLFMNDGHGNFTRDSGFLPVSGNKSCLAAADVDGDGDRDVFVGVLCDPRDYGRPMTSYLLMNDGHGRFSYAAADFIALQDLGMVTSASFADLDLDGRPELTVVGEWMPVTIFQNGTRGFTRKAIDHTSGLWQSVSIADLDGDGEPEILCGNYGLNSKLHASRRYPLKLYLSDLDGNGQTDQFLTYSGANGEFSFLGKEELEAQIPFIKKAYLSYREFAGRPVDSMFEGKLNTAVVLRVEQMASGVISHPTGKPQFTAFPAAAQASPLFSLLPFRWQNRTMALLTGGNFSGVSPYEGQYDANHGTILVQAEGNSWKALLPVVTGFNNKGETRQIVRITTASGPLIVVALNNSSLRFFRPV